MKAIASTAGVIAVLLFFGIGVASLCQLVGTWDGNLAMSAVWLFVAAQGFGLGIGFAAILLDIRRRRSREKNR